MTQPLPVLRLHSGGPASPPAAAQPQPASIASAVTGLHFVGWGGHSTGTISSPVGGAAGAAADQHHLFVVTAERMAAFSLRTGQKVGALSSRQCAALRKLCWAAEKRDELSDIAWEVVAVPPTRVLQLQFASGGSV